MSAIEIEHLTVRLDGGAGAAIVDDVSLSVQRGEVLGLIGESGAGKSTTARGMLGMFPAGARVDGTIRVGSTEVTALDARGLRRFRSESIALIAQDPRASVNPMHRLDTFLTEALRDNRRMSRAEAIARASGALERVGLDPEKVLRSYPHQVSGGMLQRVVIAAGLALQPAFLIADEPTTALDVTSQAEIIGVLRRLADAGELTLVLVTHNIELAAAICDRMVVMRGGRVLERGTAAELLAEPREDYTRELVAATRAVSLGVAAGDFPGFEGFEGDGR